MFKIFTISAVCAGCALGQAVTAGVFGPVGITSVLAGRMEPIAGAPYSAQAITERIQVLGDGNRIVQTTSANVARDSQGRIRREESLPGFTSGGEDVPNIVMIDDPVAKVHWTLDARSKTATQVPFNGLAGKQIAELKVKTATTLGVPPPPGPDRIWFTSEAGNIAVTKKDWAEATPAAKTDLGVQTVEGVPARGTQTRFTIPAGQIGNEQPIVITTETWYSPDLKVTVQSKSSDPRMGDTTYKLTNIQRSEPAASLFQVPGDYTVQDQHVPQFDYRTTQSHQE